MSRIITSIILALSLAMGGCGGGGGSSSQSNDPATSSQDNKTDLEVLLQAADVSTGAYAELLLIFSQNGTKPLFGGAVEAEKIDFSLNSEGTSDNGAENLARLNTLVDDLLSLEESLDLALTSLDNKAVESPNTVRPAGIIVDMFKSGWDFITQGKKTRTNVRKAVVKTIDYCPENSLDYFYDSLRNEQKSSNNPYGDLDFGGTPQEFKKKLEAGDLDKYAAVIHNSLLADDPFDSPYLEASQAVESLPATIVSEEGKDLVEAGSSLYLDAASSGLGNFGDGLSKGKEAVDYVKTYEEEGIKGITKKAAVATISKRIQDNLPLNETYRELVDTTGVVEDWTKEFVEKADNMGEKVVRYAQNVSKNILHSEDNKEGAQVAEQIDQEEWGYGHLVTAAPQSAMPSAATLIQMAHGLVFVPGNIADGAVFSIPTPIDGSAEEVGVSVLVDSDSKGTSTVQQITAEVVEGKYTPIVVNLEDPTTPQPIESSFAISPEEVEVWIDDPEKNYAAFELQIPESFFPPFTVTAELKETGEKLAPLQSDSRTLEDELTFSGEGTFTVEYTVTDFYGQTAAAQAIVKAQSGAAPAAIYYDGSTEFADNEGVFWDLDNVSLGFAGDGTMGGIVDGTAFAGEQFSVDGTLSGTWRDDRYTATGVVKITQIQNDESILVDSFEMILRGTIAELGGETITITVDEDGGDLHTFEAYLRE